MRPRILYISRSGILPDSLSFLQVQPFEIEQSTSVLLALGLLREKNFDFIILNSNEIEIYESKAKTMLSKLAKEAQIHSSSDENLAIIFKKFDIQNNSLNQKISLKNIKDLSKGDESFVKNMLLAYREELPHYNSEMDQHLKLKNAKGIAAMAHKLKAPLNMLGITSCDHEISELDELNFNPNYNIHQEEVIRFGVKVLDTSKSVLQQLLT